MIFETVRSRDVAACMAWLKPGSCVLARRGQACARLYSSVKPSTMGNVNEKTDKMGAECPMELAKMQEEKSSTTFVAAMLVIKGYRDAISKASIVAKHGTIIDLDVKVEKHVQNFVAMYKVGPISQMMDERDAWQCMAAASAIMKDVKFQQNKFADDEE